MSMTHGGRNLVILGIGAIVIAGVTTSVSLAMYRNSGDIYLDRSRPGYLPDPEEAEEDSAALVNFSFSDTGNLTKTDLDEYLRELHKVNDRLKAFKDPYSETPLSDESLGITDGLLQNGGLEAEE